MKTNIIFIIFFLSTVSSISFSQQGIEKEKSVSTDSLSSPRKHLSLGRFLGLGAENVGQMIFRIPKDDYLFLKNDVTVKQAPIFLGLAGLTGALMHFDQTGWRFDHNLYNTSSFYHRSADMFVFMGNGEFHFILSGAFAAYGLVFNDNTSLITASKIAEAVLSSGLFVQVLKRITGRESPAVANRSKGRWQFFPGLDQYQDAQAKYYSFPSGHLASAMATLTVIANQYPQSKWIKPVGYTILGAIGFSLVERGMHWYSDLPLGLFIGYSFGNLIAPPKADTTINDKSAKPDISILPSIGRHDFGIDVVYAF